MGYKLLSFEEPKETGRYMVYDCETQVLTGASWVKDVNNGKMCFVLDSGGRRYQDTNEVIYKKSETPKITDVISQYSND